MGDWSLLNNAMYGGLEGIEYRKDSAINTGDLYGVTSLDEDFVTFNQMIKYLKYGFGRASDYINEEIRQNRITRSEAIKIVKKYDGKCSEKYIKQFCRYINININQFWDVMFKFVNKDLFEIVERYPLKVERKFKIG